MYISTNKIRVHRLTKILDSEMFKDFEIIIEMNRASHICLDRNIGIDYSGYKTQYKKTEAD